MEARFQGHGAYCGWCGLRGLWESRAFCVGRVGVHQFGSVSLKFCKEVQLSSKICKSNIKFENLRFVIDFAICVGFIFCLLQLCHLKLTSF